MTVTTLNPFRLSIQPASVARTLEKILGLTSLAKHYDARPEHVSPESFLAYTIDALGCQVKLSGQSLHSVLPESGPTIVVANHPFGGLEGVALTRALLSVRPDTKVLTNQMLANIPELSSIFLGVDVFGKKTAHKNTQAVKRAMAHLEKGGVLLLFPAGQVSAMSWSSFTVRDRRWNSMVGRLAKKYNATCVPVFVHGQNPHYFQVGGLLHKRIRTVLLPRQLSNKTGQTLHMTIGDSISPRDISKLDSADAITDMLRMSTYLLGNLAHTTTKETLETTDNIGNPTIDSALLTELDSLAPYKLLSKGTFDVYCAPFSAMNKVFDVIAQAREKTFRAVGEGTGKEKDSDQFDPYYQHLFIWDREQLAIVGGYRLGETDTIIKNHGVNALYSRSLYQYDEAYIKKLGNALEVGRSFVTQAYQRHPLALDLLWRGIGHFVVQHPQYSVLFGCVSISSDHSEMARAFISDAMMESFKAEQKFLENVKPIIPLKVKGKVWTRGMLSSIRDISVFNKLVGQCDAGKTIPVLLRHYLALNGRFVGFSVNKGFNDSLDGLILVDLRSMPSRYISRYLGKEGSTNFLAYWKKNDTTLQRQH